jgi:outer membrane protein OmpA-like peptidoglycan-associated protein
MRAADAARAKSDAPKEPERKPPPPVVTISEPEPAPPPAAAPEASRPRVETVSRIRYENDRLEYDGQIEFLANRAVLSKDEGTRRVLRDLASFLKAYPEIEITIESHTDSRGSADANRAVSVKRASSIRYWLVQYGVRSERLKTVGKGEDEPAAPEPAQCAKPRPPAAAGCEDIWAKNRRTRFKVTRGAEAFAPVVVAPAPAPQRAPALRPPAPEPATSAPPPPKKKARPLRSEPPPKRAPKAAPKPTHAEAKPKPERAHACEGLSGFALSGRVVPRPGAPGLLFGPGSAVFVGYPLQPSLCWLELTFGIGLGYSSISTQTNFSEAAGSVWSLSIPARARVWWMKRHSLITDGGVGISPTFVSADGRDGDGDPFSYSRRGVPIFVQGALGYGFRPRGSDAGVRFAATAGLIKHVSELGEPDVGAGPAVDQYDKDAVAERLGEKADDFLSMRAYLEVGLSWLF